MKCYLDSSVLLRYILAGDRGIEKANDFEEVGSSELLEIECARVLERHRLEGLLDDEKLALASDRLRTVIGSIAVIALSDGIKRRAAGSFPTVVGTLDALHLATALAWFGGAPREETLLLTYDRQMELCARALGLRTGH